MSAPDLLPMESETPPFRLALIGPPRLVAPDGGEVALPTRKTRLLLAWLASPAGQAHTRERLAGLFWPDRGAEQARASLRNALSRLREALGPEALTADRETVTLSSARLVTDVADLERLAEHDGADPEALRALPGADFLEGVVGEAGDLDDWIAFERARLRALRERALHAAARSCLDRGETALAEELAARLVALDPLREQSHRLMMRVHASRGDRSRAIARFHELRTILRRELQVEPAPETLRLAEEIVRAERAPAPAPATPSAPAAPDAAPRAPFHYNVTVLPFANQTGDPGNDWLAEGIAEDILTALARHRDFRVTARQSSFAQGADAEPAGVARAMGARYAVAGGVRIAGERLRITARLIDGAGDRTVWADRFDIARTDIFDTQDEIVWRIIATIDAQMRLSERVKAASRPTTDLNAWERFHRALHHLYRFTREDVEEAERLCRAAIRDTPGFCYAHAGLAYAAFLRLGWHWTDDAPATLAEGIAEGEKAVALGAEDAFAACTLGRLYVYAGRLDAAERWLARALELNPSFAMAWLGMASLHYWRGEAERALPCLDEGERLNPADPLIGIFRTMRAFCLIWTGDLAGAAEVARDGIRKEARETWSRLALAAALMAQGDAEGARAAVAEARTIQPALTLAAFENVAGRAPSAMKARISGWLSEAGLPQGPAAAG